MPSSSRTSRAKAGAPSPPPSKLVPLSIRRPLNRKDDQAVVVDGVLRHLERRRGLRRRREGEPPPSPSAGVENDFGLAAVLRKLEASSCLKQQMRVLDEYKLALQDLRKGGPVMVDEQQVEDALVVLLYMYFEPRATAVRRAVSRIVSELSCGSRGGGVEVASATTFIEELVQEAEDAKKAVHGGPPSTPVLLSSQIEDLCSFPLTREAIVSSPQGMLPQAMLRHFVAPELERAVAALPTSSSFAAKEAGRGGETGTVSEPQCSLPDTFRAALEALRALIALLTACHQHSKGDQASSTSRRGVLNDDGSSLSRSISACCLTLLRYPSSPNDLRAQGALGMVLVILDRLLLGRHGPVQQARCMHLVLCLSEEGGDGSAPFQVSDLLGESRPPSWSPEALLFVAKAVLITLSPVVIMTPLPLSSPSSSSTSLLTGPTLETVLAGCSSPSPSLRLLAFGSLEAWLNKASECLQFSCSGSDNGVGNGEAASTASSLPSTETLLSTVLVTLRSHLPRIGKVILWNWEHSNKKVSASIPSVFQSYVALLELLESHASLREGIGGESHSLRHLVSVLGGLSASRRCKYEGLRTLLPRLGLSVILQGCPDLIDSLLEAISRSASLSGASSRFLIGLVERAGSELASKEEARKLWLAPIASPKALLAPLQSSRTRAANYLLESLLQMDPAAMLPLMAAIRAYSCPSPREGDVKKEGEEEEEEADMSWQDRVLWALVAVGLTGRSVGLPESEVLDERRQVGGGPGSSAMITLEELRQGCLSGNTELRLSSLLLLVSSSKSIKPLEPVEQRLYEEVLPLTLKAPLSTQRHGLLRCMRQLTSRMVEALRVARHKDRGSEAQRQSVEKSLEAIVRLLCQGLYPGANMSRDLASLESLQAVVTMVAGPAQAIDLLHQPGIVLCLFNLLLSTWDRTRLLAYDLLAIFPTPLPGLHSPTHVEPTVRWAWSLVGSPRRRESEAGALLIRVLARSYVKGLGWRIRLTALDEEKEEGRQRCVCTVEEGEEGAASSRGAAVAFFLGELRDVIRGRLDMLAAVLDSLLKGGEAAMTSPPRNASIHGLIQALRFTVEETASLLPVDDEGSFLATRSLLESLTDQMKRALQLALQVIGESEEEDLIVAARQEDGTDRYVAHVGPVVTSGGLKEGGAKGFLVDCRGHLYQEEGGDEGDDVITDAAGGMGRDDGNDDGAERLVVGAWLMTREAGACLVAIIKSVPLVPPSEGMVVGDLQEGWRSSEPLLTDKRIVDAGLKLLLALGRFKHMGGIQVTQQALQSLINWILVHASQRPDLARLPSQWLTALLERLHCPSPRFILRRSAGLAYGFLAIVGAEPKSSPSTLLPTLIRELLRSIIPAPPSEQQAQQQHWGIRVHALNVLRLILIDRGINKNVTQGFITEVTAVVLQGFRDSQWAIRNSSLMVFSALVTLIVGAAKNDLGSSPQGGTAATSSASSSSVEAADFFGRHLDFFELVVEAFREATLDSDRARTVAPALYPMLLLLSRLWLSGQVALPDSRSESMMRECISYIMVCARQPNALIRSVSARALASLTPSEQAPTLIIELLGKLPSLQEVTAQSIIDHTEMHGALLMISSLLQVRILDLQQPAPQQQRQQEGANALSPILTQLMGPKAWLAGAAMKCPMVRQGALEALHFFSTHHESLFPPPSAAEDGDTSRESHGGVVPSRAEVEDVVVRSTRDLVAFIGDLTTGSVGVTSSSSSSNRFMGIPCLPQLLAWVVENITGAVEEITMVSDWLEHPVLEVRQAALRRLMKTYGGGSAILPSLPSTTHALSAMDLLRVLVRVAQGERSLTHLRVVLEALCRISSSSSPSQDWDVSTVWPLLERLVACGSGEGGNGDAATTTTAHVLGIANGDVASLALELMGACVRWSSGGRGGIVTSGALTGEQVRRWSTFVASSSMPLQSPALRQASCRSIHASRIMHLVASESTTGGHPWEGAAIRAGFTLIRLMQDDNETIRAEARLDLSAFVVSTRDEGKKSSSGSHHNHASRDLVSQCAANELMDIMRAWRGVGSTAVFVEEVAKALAEGSEGLTEALQNRHLTSGASSFFARIFEPEPANIHVEPCAVAFLSFRYLLHRLAENSSNPADKDRLGGNGGDMVIQSLQSSWEPLRSGLVAQALAESTWLGGLTYDPEIYGRLFCSALAGIVLRTIGDGGAIAGNTPDLSSSGFDSSPPHAPIVWALKSLRMVDQVLSEADEHVRGGGGGAVAERARLVMSVMEWSAVDDFGPFTCPRFWENTP